MAENLEPELGPPRQLGDPAEQRKLDTEYMRVLENAPVPGGEHPRRSAVRALATAAALAMGVLAVTVGLLGWLVMMDSSSPESALSLVFVSAAVVLILVVCTLTIVFKRLNLEDSAEAMGLPKGSVRAVIALMLILLFFIAAIFLFSSTQRDLSGEPRELNGISLSQFQALNAEEIVSSSSAGSGSNTTYDVTLLPAVGNTAVSDDIAKQLITTVGTLVTAVAAFYFGANSVTTGVGLGMSKQTGEDAAKDQAAKDQAAKDQAAKDQAAKDQAAKDQAANTAPTSRSDPAGA